jgi:CheY-like chemotaxis protein
MNETNGPLVLVVDDDSRSRELMRLVLSHAGYRVLTAPEARSAAAVLQAERPVLVLADFTMPGMSGLDLCRWIRSQPGLAGLRFVLLTGMDDDETRADAQAAGADAVVTKPFDRMGLLAQLSTLLAA